MSLNFNYDVFNASVDAYQNTVWEAQKAQKTKCSKYSPSVLIARLGSNIAPWLTNDIGRVKLCWKDPKKLKTIVQEIIRSGNELSLYSHPIEDNYNLFGLVLRKSIRDFNYLDILKKLADTNPALFKSQLLVAGYSDSDYRETGVITPLIYENIEVGATNSLNKLKLENFPVAHMLAQHHPEIVTDSAGNFDRSLLQNRTNNITISDTYNLLFKEFKLSSRIDRPQQIESEKPKNDSLGFMPPAQLSLSSSLQSSSATKKIDPSSSSQHPSPSPLELSTVSKPPFTSSTNVKTTDIDVEMTIADKKRKKSTQSSQDKALNKKHKS